MDYGSDIALFPDADLDFNLVSGPKNVAEQIVRRWLTPRGFFEDFPYLGAGLQSYLQDVLDERTADNIAKILENEARDDDRIKDVSVTTLSFSEGNLRYSVHLVLVDSSISVDFIIDPASEEIITWL